MEREFLIRLDMRSQAFHNGFDHATITECGSRGPVAFGEIYRAVRGGVIGCTICGGQDVRFYQPDEIKCEHAAIMRTWIRQGWPEGRVYFIDEGRIGYYKDGKRILLSTVDAVNRTGR